MCIKSQNWTFVTERDRTQKQKLIKRVNDGFQIQRKKNEQDREAKKSFKCGI